MLWGPGAVSRWGGSLGKAQGSETRSLRSYLPESQRVVMLVAVGNGEAVQPGDVLRAGQDGQESPARTMG